MEFLHGSWKSFTKNFLEKSSKHSQKKPWRIDPSLAALFYNDLFTVIARQSDLKLISHLCV